VKNPSKLSEVLMMFVLLFLAFGSLVTAQSKASAQPKLQWQRCLGGGDEDQASCIEQTKDGGYIVVGRTYSNDGDVSGNHGTDDLWIVKIDKNGKIQWEECIGGTETDGGWSVKQTADGGYVVAGYAFGESKDGNVEYDLLLVKLDETGKIQWQRSYGGSGYDYAMSVQQTRDGGYIVAGSTNSNDRDVSENHGLFDYWVLKLDSDGNIQWQSCFGGSSPDYAQSIQQTVDGGYIVVGYTSSSDGDVKEKHRFDDIWIVKLDETGKIQWQKCLGGNGDDAGFAVRQTLDRGYIMVGHTYSDEGDVSFYHEDGDGWVVKLDENGKIQWHRCLGGKLDDGARSVQQTSDGGYIVAGYTYSDDGDVSGNRGDRDAWLVKLDSNGNIEWQKCLGGSSEDDAYSVLQSSDGGYVVAGYTFSNDKDVKGNHGNYDIWIVKLGY